MPIRLRNLLILVAAAIIPGLIYFFATRPRDYPITNPHPSGANIIAFGDSLTAGNGASEDQAYPAQLARLVGVPILNKGKSGDTTASALERLDGDVLGNDPRIVLVCLGGNDAIQKVADDTLIRNLQTIIQRIQAHGALVILIGLDVINDGRLAGEYAALARRTGCPFVPDILRGIFGHPDLMSDMIHPNAAGYALMAKRIEPALRTYSLAPGSAPSGSGAGGLML